MLSVAVQFHLPQPVLCLHISLRKKEVILILSINIRNTPIIPVNFYFHLEAFKLHHTINGRKAPLNKDDRY